MPGARRRRLSRTLASLPLKYDILALDLDGTLLGPDGVVAPVEVDAVVRAREAGLEIVVATGRALVGSGGPISAIAHEGMVIAAGGSILCDAVSGTTLGRSAMPRDLVVDVAESLIRHDHKALLLKDPSVTGYDYLAVGPAELNPASAWWFETLPVRVRFVHDIAEDPHPDDTVRAGAVASAEELAPIARSLMEEIGDRAFLQHWSAVTQSRATNTRTHLLEVFSPDVNKWTTMWSHYGERGFDRERIAAIGDGLNDVELIRESGLGVAMENADPRVLAVADCVTGPSGGGGVAAAIDEILRGAW